MRAPLSTLTILAFLLNTFGPLPAKAQGLVLPTPGVRVSLSPEFTPAHLKGITIHRDNALRFDFLVHKGNQPLADDAKRQEYNKLIKYFLTSLTVPDKDQWVNLSPYEKDRIIENNFGKTEMGRDLLGQDYLLKQITASLIYPEEGLGRKFWDKVYERAFKEYGTTNIPVNTFNKVWIVPDKAVVYESGNTAYILKSHLKVMLEEDYLALEKGLSPPNVSIGGPGHDVPSSGFPTKAFGNDKGVNTIGSQVVREIVLPALEKEVNEGHNFAQLRQIYSAMILATWYKKALKESLLGKVYADKAKVTGVEPTGSVILSEAKDLKQKKDSSPSAQNDVEGIYQQYLKAFKKGVYNYIKEEQDPVTQQIIPRKYFSGGFVREDSAMTVVNAATVTHDQAELAGQQRVEDIDQAMVDLNTTDAAMQSELRLGMSPEEIFSPERDLQELRNFVAGHAYSVKAVRGVVLTESVVRRVVNFANIQARQGKEAAVELMNDGKEDGFELVDNGKALPLNLKTGVVTYNQVAQYVEGEQIEAHITSIYGGHILHTHPFGLIEEHAKPFGRQDAEMISWRSMRPRRDKVYPIMAGSENNWGLSAWIWSENKNDETNNPNDDGFGSFPIIVVNKQGVPLSTDQLRAIGIVKIVNTKPYVNSGESPGNVEDIIQLREWIGTIDHNLESREKILESGKILWSKSRFNKLGRIKFGKPQLKGSGVVLGKEKKPGIVLGKPERKDRAALANPDKTEYGGIDMNSVPDAAMMNDHPNRRAFGKRLFYGAAALGALTLSGIGGYEFFRTPEYLSAADFGVHIKKLQDLGLPQNATQWKVDISGDDAEQIMDTLENKPKPDNFDHWKQRALGEILDEKKEGVIAVASGRRQMLIIKDNNGVYLALDPQGNIKVFVSETVALREKVQSLDKFHVIPDEQNTQRFYIEKGRAEGFNIPINERTRIRSKTREGWALGDDDQKNLFWVQNTSSGQLHMYADVLMKDGKPKTDYPIFQAIQEHTTDGIQMVSQIFNDPEIKVVGFAEDHTDPRLEYRLVLKFAEDLKKNNYVIGLEVDREVNLAYKEDVKSEATKQMTILRFFQGYNKNEWSDSIVSQILDQLVQKHFGGATAEEVRKFLLSAHAAGLDLIPMENRLSVGEAYRKNPKGFTQTRDYYMLKSITEFLGQGRRVLMLVGTNHLSLNGSFKAIGNMYKDMYGNSRPLFEYTENKPLGSRLKTLLPKDQLALVVVSGRADTGGRDMGYSNDIAFIRQHRNFGHPGQFAFWYDFGRNPPPGPITTKIEGVTFDEFNRRGIDQVLILVNDPALNPDRAAIAETNKVAMRAPMLERNPSDVGGIDMNSANLNLQIKRDGKGVPLPLQLQDMEKLQSIEGFVPVIINIVPVTSLPFLSELQEKSKPQQAMAQAS